MTGTQVSWIYIKTASMRTLSAEIGLRPDTNLLNVEIEPSGGATLTRWTGSSFTEKSVTWEGLNKALDKELSNPPSRLLTGHRLSVAVYHVCLMWFVVIFL